MTQTETIASQAPEPERLPQTMGKLAALLGSEDYPTGERAMLKRMVPGSPPPLPFYRLAYRHLPEGWERRHDAWITLVAGLALTGAGGHRQNRKVGQALAETRYSEARLERLLAAEGDTLHTLVLRAARFLAAKGQAVNWLDFTQLLGLSGDPEHARMQIARDYYRNFEQKKD